MLPPAPHSLRLALAGLAGSPLGDLCASLCSAGEVRELGDPFLAAKGLLDFAPHALLVDFAAIQGARGGLDHDRTQQMLGACKAIAGLHPGLPIVGVLRPEHEVALAPLLRRHGLIPLCAECSLRELAEVLDRALLGPDTPASEPFADLLHGIADMVHNPLLFLMGHLQLLELQAPQDLEATVAAALQGGKRVQEAVETLRRAVEATAPPRSREVLDLPQLLAQAGFGGPGQPEILHQHADHHYRVEGDPGLLGACFADLAKVCQDAVATGLSCRLRLDQGRRSTQVTAELHGEALAAWQLPLTFAPYHLCRTLRGSANGLALFTMQAVVHGHGGRATARRLPEGGLAIELALPAPLGGDPPAGSLQ